MIDEHDLRRRLHDAAGTIDAPAGLRSRSERRAAERRRRRELGLRAGTVAVLAVVVAAVGLVAAGRSEAPDRVAVATPRSERPGWSPVADAPIGPRFQHAAVAMGDDAVLVFGGYGDDGEPAGGAAVYTPSTGTWTKVDDPPLDPGGAPAAWTGERVLALASDGRLVGFDPASASWDEERRSPFTGASNAVTALAWTGNRLLVVNGADGRPGAAAYDPATERWEVLPAAPVDLSFFDAVWTGSELVVVGDTGGSGRRHPRLVVLRFDPDDRTWHEAPASPLADAGRRTHGFAAWTGTELVVGGGRAWSAEASALADRLVRENRSATPDEHHVLDPRPALDAAAWNPVTDTWRTLPDAPAAVSGLERYAEIWTGRHVVAWAVGGDPVLLDPSTAAWSVLDPAPEGTHQDAPMVWTGHELFVWSGEPVDGDASDMECCTPSASGYTLRL